MRRIARLVGELASLGMDRESDRPSRWYTVGWANGLRLGLSEGRQARVWADVILAAYPESDTAHRVFRQAFAHEMARHRHPLAAAREAFDAAAVEDLERGFGISVAVGIRCAREPDLATRLAEVGVEQLDRPQRFLADRLRSLATNRSFGRWALLPQVLAFLLPPGSRLAQCQLIALRRGLRRRPRWARLLRVSDWAPHAFLEGFRLARRHRKRAEAILDGAPPAHLVRLLFLMDRELGLDRRHWTTANVATAMTSWLRNAHGDFAHVPLRGHRARFRVAAAFDVAFWFGMVAALIEDRHPRVLVPDRN